MRKILIWIGLIMLFGCNQVTDGSKVPKEAGSVVPTTKTTSIYESPEETIRTYHESSNQEDVSNCFYPTGFSGTLEKIWSDYVILSMEQTKKSGQNYQGLAISKDAVEIIVEVTMKETQKKTKFWYLLQPVEGQWKIIEHSHIPDTNYPAYD